MSRKEYFTNFESSQLLVGAKTEDPWEKPPDHLQAELDLSHMWPELGSNPHRWDDKRFNGLNHSAMGATSV